MNVKNIISVVSLTFFVLAFSLGAIAQAEKPLDAETVTELIEELTDGLPDVIDNEGELEQISEKWEARKNLVGKTKSQILNLLFTDVKSVIADKQMQNSIWQQWIGERDGDDGTLVETPRTPPAQPVNKPEKSVTETSNPECPIFWGKSFGVVKSYDAAKGYGYITPELGAPGAGQDIFVHVRGIHGAIKILHKDMKVVFELCISPGPKPYPRAIKVQGHTRYEN